jgi:hypothetical protein
MIGLQSYIICNCIICLDNNLSQNYMFHAMIFSLTLLYMTFSRSKLSVTGVYHHPLVILLYNYDLLDDLMVRSYIMYYINMP